MQDGVVFALVPLGVVEALGAVPSLHYMSAQTVSEPAVAAASGRVAVDGAAKVGAERLHRDGVTGAGVNVGILDFGFGRHLDLPKQGRVPAPAAAKAFNNSGRWDDGIPHGTASLNSQGLELMCGIRSDSPS